MDPIIIDRQWVQGALVKTDATLLEGYAFTEESGAHTFRISGVDEDGNDVTLSGTVLAKMLRADNVTVDVDGSVSGGKALVTLVGDCYNVPGRFRLTIYLSDGTKSQTIYSGVGTVCRATSGTEIDSGTTVPSLQQLEAAYNNCLDIYDELKDFEIATVAETTSYLGVS